MFKQFWKDDYEFYSSQKGYALGKSIIYYIMIALVIFFNYALMSTPVNAYMESGSAFTIENFTDYKSIEQCNYSLSATEVDGVIKDAESKITMNCYTLNNTSPLANDYVYIKTSDKVYQAKYYNWVSADDLTLGQQYTYLSSLKGSSLLNPTGHPTQEGVTIYSPTEMDYLKQTGNTWDYYKILQFVPSWISENKYIYEDSINGNVYYSINSSNPGYINDSYYKYDRDGNIVYNQYAELADIKVDYLFYDDNQYGYGSNDMNGNAMSVDGYVQDFVTLVNVNKALYKLQHYEHTYNNLDINGVVYGNEGFIAESYFKDGVYYLWDTSENLFYAYEINTLQELGFISEADVVAQKNAGNTIINKDAAKKLISNVMKYREFFETTYTLESSVSTAEGTTLEATKAPESSSNSYTEYEISSNPISYDSRYSYYWIYVSEYLYEYISQFQQMNYKYSITPQTKTDVDQTTTTYTLQQESTATTTGDPKAGYGLCSSLTSVGPGTKCYTSTTSTKYSYVSNYTTTIYSKNTSGTVSNEVGNLNYTESKDVYIGGIRTTIYKLSNGSWVYLDSSTTKYKEYLNTNTYTLSRTNSTPSTVTLSSSSLPSDRLSSKNLNEVTLSAGTTYNIYNPTPTANPIYSTYYKNKYRHINSSSTEYYYEGDVPSSVTNNLKSSIKDELAYGTSTFYIDAGTTGNYLYDYKENYYPYFVFIRLYNKTDGYTYYATPYASFGTSYKNIEITYPNTNDGGHWNCDGICVTAQQSGLLTGKIWYSISSNEYNVGKFDFVNKEQQNLPEHASKKSGLINHRNATAGYKITYNNFDYDNKQLSKSVNAKSGGTISIKYGYNTYSRQSSIPSNRYTDEGLEVTSGQSAYAISCYQTAKYAQKMYIKYSVTTGQDSDAISYVKSSGTTSGSGSDMKYYIGEGVATQVPTSTSYTYQYYTYKVSLSTTGGNTNWYRAAYNGTNYYYANNTSGFDTRYSSTQQSTSTIYSVSKIDYYTPSATITTKSLSYNTADGIIKYYKPITSTTQAIAIQAGTSAPGIAASDAAKLIKAQYSSGVQSVTVNGNNLSITFVDGTVKTVTGTVYKNYTYYTSNSSIDNSTGDSSGTYSNSGNVTYESFSTKQYGNSQDVGVTPTSTTKSTSSTAHKNTVLIETVVTNVKTTITTKKVYKYVGLEETSNIVKLYNENVSASIPSNNVFDFKGYKDSLDGAYTTLTGCSSGETGVCYQHVSTVRNRELEAKTAAVTSNVVYSQDDKTDFSLTPDNNAYYNKHIPTASEASSSEYERRICTSGTDTNCYRDNPKIEVSFAPRYSIKTTTTTYQIKANESDSSIYYSESTPNSTLNSYAEFGILNDAKYYNDGSFAGGVYTKRNETGGIASLNKFNEKSWFISGNFNNLVKKETNGEYNLSGNGTTSYVINNLTSDSQYTLSFMAKSVNDKIFRIYIDGAEKNVNLTNVYPGIRSSVSFTASSDKATIQFVVVNDITIKEIAVKEGSDIVYTEYASYRMGEVSDTFYQTYRMIETYSYYDVKAGEETNGYALTNESMVIGYNNTIHIKDGKSWEEGLIKLNEQSQIDSRYVLMGNDFNQDGTIATNEKYAIGKGALYSICLDGEACHYRYLLTGNSEDLKYAKTRTLTARFSSYPEYLDKTSVLDIDKVNDSSLDGSDSRVNSNTIITIDAKTQFVKVNGGWYPIDSNFGQYSLFMEYLNDYHLNNDSYKYDAATNTIYLRNTVTDYFKYEVLHDDNKLYNAVTDQYDKLDKGYTLETKYSDKSSLTSVINSLLETKDYLNEKSVVRSYTDTAPKLSQEKLFALYEANNESVSFSCKDINLGVTLENCTFTYKANGGKEPITLEDLLDDHLVANNAYFGVIISNKAFDGKNPYYRYNNLDYKFEYDASKIGYDEYQRYLFGGYWEEKDVILNNDFNHYSNNYASVNGIHTKKDEYLTFYQINDNGNKNIYVNNTSLYIFYNSHSEKGKDVYETDRNDKYFYAWITGDVSKTPYKNYDIVQVIAATEVYSYITKMSDSGDDSIGTRYILVNNGTIRIGLKDMFVTQGDTQYLYQLKGKADSKDMRINNLISLADLEVLDMGQGIDSDKLAGVNSVSAESVSYAIRFSGMLNYWNTTINGDNFITQDTDAKTCTLDIQKVHQKNSTINFITASGELETVSEFILQNRGKQGNNYKGQNTYDLYALTKVLEDDQYFDVTLGGSSGNNLITTFVEALNILYRNGYTGYMFKDSSNADKSNALKELSKLDYNEIFDWEKLAINPENAEKWFGDSAYANLIYYLYVKDKGIYNAKENKENSNLETVLSNGVHLYNAQDAFLSNTPSNHYDYYNDILKVLYSHLLLGVLYPNYTEIFGKSYPHLTDLSAESSVTKNISGVSNHGQESQFGTYLNQILLTYQTLLNNENGIYNRMVSNQDKASINANIVFPQAVGTIVDSYTVLNSYEIVNLPEHNKYNTLKVENEILINMIPTMMFSNDMDMNINIIRDAGGSNLLEMHISSLLDYVSQVNGSDFVFVKSEKTKGRYYIYKLLESSDKSGSYDGAIPAATIIRQNTLVTNNNYSKYNDGNQLVALNDNTKTYMTAVQNLKVYADSIAKSDIENFGKWWGDLFTGKLKGVSGDTDAGNVVYHVIWSGAFNEILKLTTINNLSTYVWTTEMTDKKYISLNSYSSLNQINPTWYYDYLEINDSDIENSSLSEDNPYNPFNPIPTGTRARQIKRINDTFTNIAKNPTGEISENDNALASIFTGSSFYLKQFGNDGKEFYKDEKQGQKQIKSYNLKVVLKGDKLYEDSTETCNAKYCVAIRLPYNYEIQKLKMSSIYMASNTYIDSTEYTFEIISEIDPYNLSYTNGHSTKNAYSIFDESHINELTLSVDYLENNLTEDTDYAIGTTNFSVSVSNVGVTDVKNLRYQFAHNLNDFEYSLTYVAKRDRVCDGDGFEYNDYTKLCHFISKSKDELTLNNWTYEYTIPVTATYVVLDYDEESGMTNTEVYTVEKTIQLLLSSRNFSQKQLDELVENKFNSLYSGYYHNYKITSKDYSQDVKVHLNIYNTASNTITFDNLPADTTFTLSVQKRMFSGYTTKLWTKEFTTGTDMVMNPYGKSLSSKPTLTLTNEHISNGLINGDALLKEEYIPYDLQKCVFSYDTSKDPTSEGVSVCGKYVISNKYRLQLSAPETIKIAFAIVDEKGTNVFAYRSGAIGKNIAFVEDINAINKKYHIVNNKSYTQISDGNTKNDAGLFYYEFNETDFEEYKKYNSALDFVNNYILQHYTIEIERTLYSNYMNRYFRGHEFSIKVMEYYADRFTYLDYNQNGKYDESALNAAYKYYDKNGISTYYEKTNVELYRDNCLASSIDSLDKWTRASLFVNGKEYSTFKPGEYKINGGNSHYYIFGYDPNNQAQIIR